MSVARKKKAAGGVVEEEQVAAVEEVVHQEQAPSQHAEERASMPISELQVCWCVMFYTFKTLFAYLATGVRRNTASPLEILRSSKKLDFSPSSPLLMPQKRTCVA
jgi:hypothetical protein